VNTSVLPLISVVIPCYNHAAFLEEAIRSVWEQLPDLNDRARLEIIVCDDASTDGSFELAQKLAETSPCPMRVFQHEENLGAPRTSRRAAQEAQGDFLVFHSSDDIMAPGRLAWQTRYLLEAPNCDLVYGSGYRFDSDAPETRLPLYLDTTIKLFNAPLSAVLTQLYTQSSPFFIQSAMLRMSAYRDAIQTFSDDILADDWVLTIRLFEALQRTGRDVGFCEEDSLYYRLHGQGQLQEGNLHQNLPKQTRAKQQVFEAFTPPEHRSHALATMYWTHYRRAVEMQQWRLAWAYLLKSLYYGFKPIKGPWHVLKLLLAMLKSRV
jgi:glycosyltransferase involved in cell wall biosynthesis